MNEEALSRSIENKKTKARSASKGIVCPLGKHVYTRTIRRRGNSDPFLTKLCFKGSCKLLY